MSNDCIVKSEDAKIVFTEKSRRCEFINVEKKLVYKYNIDKCLMKEETKSKKCDYGLKTERDFYFIELKGTNVTRACQQIYDTIDFFKKQRKSDLHKLSLQAIIVPTKNSVPNLKSDPNFLKLYRLLGKENMKIQSRTVSISIVSL